MPSTIITKNGSGAPLAADLVAGELAVDLTNGRLYTEDTGGSVVELGTNPAADVTFADNVKAIFGAGSDLQIYHDGSASYIADTGTGTLNIKASGSIRLRGNDTDELLARFNENGSNQFYYDSAEKLATTSTGIDVTGTVTADGLTVESNGAGILVKDSNDIGSTTFRMQNSSGVGLLLQHFSDTRNVDLYVDDTKSVTFSNNNDISFYEDTGTTAKFFWDASAESLGIGTSSPNRVLHVEGTPTTFGDTRSVLQIADETAMAAGVGGGLVFTGKATTGQGDSNTAFAGIHGEKENGTSTNTAGAMVFSTRTSGSNPAERMRIDSSGNVTIGSSTLAADAALKFQADTGTFTLNHDRGAHALVLSDSDGTGEILRVDTSGNLLVSNTTPVIFSSSSITGHNIAASGTAQHNASEETVMYLNRLSTDGPIADFRKDGSTVGSIGTNSDKMYFAGANEGIAIDDSLNAVIPVTSTGAGNNAAVDLGASGGPAFKDLYLSGGVNQSTVLVSALPAAASSTGYRFMVSDSTVAASGNFGATVAGSGSNVVPVFSDGTNWLIG